MTLSAPITSAGVRARLRTSEPYALNRDLNPHVRLRKNGNGLIMREFYSQNIGIVVPTPTHMVVIAFGYGAMIDRAKIAMARDAAWIVIAHLQLRAAQRIADPLQPIPSNADAFMMLWAEVGATLHPLPAWIASGPAAGSCTLNRYGTFDLVGCEGQWVVRRRNDGLRLSHRPVQKLTFCETFTTRDDAMVALMAMYAGWNAYTWR